MFILRRYYEKKVSTRSLKVHLNRKFSNISIADTSYGSIVISSFGDPEEEVVIGEYCSIASGTKLILGGGHYIKGGSSYPFKVKMFNHPYEAKGRGAIVIQDDVWIATGCLILSGVTLAQGSVIGAGSVVRESTLPYGIYYGNPATLVGYRYESKIIEKMSKFNIKKLIDCLSDDELLEFVYKSASLDYINFILEKYGEDSVCH